MIPTRLFEVLKKGFFLPAEIAPGLPSPFQGEGSGMRVNPRQAELHGFSKAFLE